MQKLKTNGNLIRREATEEYMRLWEDYYSPNCEIVRKPSTEQGFQNPFGRIV